MCWCKLLAQCRCGKCGILCCARDKKSPKGSKPGTNTDTLPLTIRYENADQKEVHSIQGKGDIIKGSPRATAISLPHCDTTTELTVLQHRKAGLDFSPQRLSQCSGSIDRPTPPLLKVIECTYIFWVLWKYYVENYFLTMFDVLFIIFRASSVSILVKMGV